jgi:hypothetical protein
MRLGRAAERAGDELCPEADAEHEPLRLDRAISDVLLPKLLHLTSRNKSLRALA